MFIFDTNGPQVFQDIKTLFQDMPRILDFEQDRLEAIIRTKIRDQFEILSREETVQDAVGGLIAWYGISDMTADIREDYWRVDRYNPVLVVTGALRHAVENGTTIAIKDGANSFRLSYLPGQDQAEKIEKHEEGFTVTEPVSQGRYSHPRPAVFWGENLTDAVVNGLERGLESLIRSRGF